MADMTKEKGRRTQLRMGDPFAIPGSRVEREFNP